MKIETDIVKTYLSDISRFPLLSHEQEIECGTAIQLFNETQEDFSDYEELGKLSRQATKKLIESNLRLPVSIAKKYQNPGMELMDLIEAGNMGLMVAVSKYDPTRGYKFSTYAYWWIRQAISRSVSQQSRLIYTPSNVSERINKIRKAKKTLSRDLNRNPTLFELSAFTGIEQDVIKKSLSVSYCRSLDVPVGQNKVNPLIDLIEDDRYISVDEETDLDLSRDSLEVAMERLEPYSRETLKLLFGLIDGVEREVKQVANILNLTHEEVYRFKSKGLSKLKNESPQLIGFLP